MVYKIYTMLQSYFFLNKFDKEVSLLTLKRLGGDRGEVNLTSHEVFPKSHFLERRLNRGF